MKGYRYKITGYLEIASLLRSEMLEKKRKEKRTCERKHQFIMMLQLE